MKDLTFTGSHEQALRDQIIDAARPGSILHDFQVVLDFVGTEGVVAAGKYNVLPMASFAELNGRLNRPLRLKLKRPQLRSNPYLMGLNLLLRASGLGRVEGSGAKTRLVVDPAMLLQWERLNPVERYFNLLEAWLFVGRPEMVGERGSWIFGGYFMPCVQAWQSISNRRSRFNVKEPGQLYFSGIGRDFFNLALMDLFGLLEVKQPPGEVPTWFPAGAHSTPFGDALFTLLLDRYMSSPGAIYDDEAEVDEDVESEEDEEDGGIRDDEPGALERVRFGRLQPFLQPYFPEWRENLEPPGVEVREGIFIFRVSLGKVWRRLAVPSKCSLDDLVAVILDSVKFDEDHLYEFTFRDSFGAEARVMHPYCDEGPFGDELCVGALPLSPGQSMRLTYDFGDCWRFDVKLERVDPPDRRIKAPRILESHGKAPEQYPSYDD
jgi:hypothetical protein